MVKWLRNDTFEKDGTRYSLLMRKQGNRTPPTARIIVKEWYWEDVGGLKGWETVSIYDKEFDDWNYAHAVYDEILKRRGGKQ